MFAPSEHLASLNWPEIRRQFEEEGIGAIVLARMHNIASVTTIRRKIKSEGWRLPGETVTEAVNAVQFAPPEPPAPAAPPAPIPPPAPPPPPPIDSDSDAEMIPMAEVVAERALHETAAQIQAEKGAPTVGEVLGVNHLAQLHTERIKAQMEIGGKVTGAGLKVFEIISVLLDADEDAGNVIRASIALRKLTNVNPDRDTLAGLLKAAADVVARGISIERRALGMDVQRRPGGTVDSVPELASPRRPAGELIKMLDPATAFKLREMAQKTIMERRQNEIAAQVEAE